MTNRFPETPEPPYHAVIFTTQRTDIDEGYEEMAAEMERLAARQDGFLGLESAHSGDGYGLTVSYWRDEEAITTWKNDVRHLAAQRLGNEKWYETFQLRVARVERAYSGPNQ